MYDDELKRKLRQLKKLEVKLRFGNSGPPRPGLLVWNDFFTNGVNGEKDVKYPFAALLKMDKEEIKSVYAEFLYTVYHRYYIENGILPGGLYDPKLLSQLGLPHDASLQEIKKRFRELAMLHHPDRGGDGNRFIELMAVYDELIK